MPICLEKSAPNLLPIIYCSGPYKVQMADSKLWLSWETYQKNICNGLGLLQQRGEFVDMTIAADGHHVKVHQMIMSLVSPYIKELIKSTQCAHPVVFLNRVSYETLQLILEYAYSGEAMVTRDKLPEFLEACSVLQIKGLDHEINIAADGDLLNFVGARGEPAEPTTDQRTNLPQYNVQKKSSPLPELEYDDDISHDNEQIFEETPMDEDNDFSETDVNDFIESTEEPLKEDLLVPKGCSTAVPISSTIQYCLSCQGSIQLVLNRFIYHMKHTRKNSETVWRCSENKAKGCKANVVTKGDVVLKRVRTHNHPFHDKQILKRIAKGNMYTGLKAVENVAALNKTLTNTANKQLLR